MKKTAGLIAAFLVTTSALCFADDYAVVIQSDTANQAGWKAVATALVEKHGASVLTWEKEVQEVLPQLAALHPRYSCFVTPRDQATREYVAAVHQLTRRLDRDPYTDTRWGILTGFDAANALAIAKHDKPLVIRRVASGTELALEMCQEGLWYDELVKNKLVRRDKGGEVRELKGPDDTTSALVDSLNEYQPDLFVTSGHATERGWQIGFTYRNGFFRSRAGQLFGEDTKRKTYAVESPNAKVYLPIGNCLMGHIDGPDAMALAWMNDAGVKQMMGYTVPTWFGYGGWGVLDYFVEQPGRYTLTDAFFANHHALIHSIETKSGNQRGMEFDRDVVAFYGDPGWSARMADARCAYNQTLTNEGDTWTLSVTPNRGNDSFKPVNTNGAQRGWRPVVQWLPFRVQDIEVVEGQEHAPVVADDFVLVPNPREFDFSRKFKVVFRARPVKESAADSAGAGE